MPGSSTREGPTMKTSPRCGPLAILAVVLSVLVFAGVAEPVEAQFSSPCEVGCATTLAATSFVVAMGTAVAVGRLHGGYSTTRGGISAWLGGFTTVALAGMAMSGNGERQERTIYSAGLGAVGGGLAGLAVGSLIGESDRTSRLAATFVGAATGALVGGAIGAITHDEPATATLLPLFSIDVGF